MAVASLQSILDDAFANRYGVAAINIVDDLSLGAVIEAAADLESPLIVQTSLKTVKSIGAQVLHDLFTARAETVSVPLALHLDHCPEREWISICLQTGWSSVLFDGSHLDIDANTQQTREVVAEARACGAQVEGEIEAVRGVEDGIGSDGVPLVHPIQASSDFIARTGVYCFAPAVGTAHGLYAKKPELMPQRVTDLVEQQPIPMVLHGGTGLTAKQFVDLISRGCAKVNISTAIKIAYVDATRAYLDAHPGTHDPPALFAHVRAALKKVASAHIEMFGSAGHGRLLGSSL